MNKVNASHILVKTEEEAKKIMDKIKEGASFEDMARVVSMCPSGKQGGSLGWFERGQMVPEFDDACFSGEKGDMKIIKTQFGWHIIKINDCQ